jgi:hypothetical protein
MISDFIFLSVSLILAVIFICKNKFENFDNNKLFDNQEYLKNLNRNKIFFDNSKIDKYAKLYYDVPLDINHNVDNFDKSVLKNIRVSEKANTYTQELKYNDIIKIINKIKENNLYKIKITLEKKEFGTSFTNLFNQIFSKLNMNNKYHKDDKRKYKMVDFRILIYKELYGSFFKVVYEVIIYKDLKNNGFVFQNTIKYDISNNTINYINIDLVGIKNQEDIIFTNKYQVNEKKCKFDVDLKKDECFKLDYPNEEKSNKYMEKYQKKYLEDLEKEKKNEIYYKSFKCFNNDGFNQATCESYNFEKKTKGVWDKPCENNNECPFYKKNKNYTNTRGGCKNGYCEMPLNIKRFGFRYFSKDQKPLCYNCNIKNCLGEECYMCCEEQKNRKKYSNLKSPDYIFKNDYLER